MAMTEDQLVDAIEQTMQAAHRQCPRQRDARRCRGDSAVLRTESCISSNPTGPHASVDRVSIALMQDPVPAANPA
jgi:hypothetical protein